MIHNNIFVSVPVEYIFKEREYLEKYKFNIELKIFAKDLDELKIADFIEIKEFISSINARLTFHAPFIDMSPGSFDSKIREITLERFIKVMDIASFMKPENIVFHTGYFEPIHSWFFDMWLDECVKTWSKVVRYCEKIDQRISFENVFERNYAVIDRLLDKISSSFCGVCLDVGHHNVFSNTPIERWFSKFGTKIFELHIHDNDGSFDWHMAVGDGKINFEKIFELTRKHCPNAVITLEAHDTDTMLKTYRNVLKILSS